MGNAVSKKIILVVFFSIIFLVQPVWAGHNYLEIENCTYDSTWLLDSYVGHSGGAALSMVAANGGSFNALSCTISLPTTHTYNVILTYTNGYASGNSTGRVRDSANTTTLASYTLPANNDWYLHSPETIWSSASLSSGSFSFKLAYDGSNSQSIVYDVIDFYYADPTPTPTPSNTPTPTPSPTPDVQNWSFWTPDSTYNGETKRATLYNQFHSKAPIAYFAAAFDIASNEATMNETPYSSSTESNLRNKTPPTFGITFNTIHRYYGSYNNPGHDYNGGNTGEGLLLYKPWNFFQITDGEYVFHILRDALSVILYAGLFFYFILRLRSFWHH